MTTRQQLVDEARSWLNTPFGHQQAIKGVAVDCTNYIARVAENAGATPDIEFEANYRRQEDGQEMLRLLGSYLEYVPADAMKPADVLALCDELRRAPDVPRHLAIVTQLEPYPKIIHASEHGVREHKLGTIFKNRIHSCWRIRDIKD